MPAGGQRWANLEELAGSGRRVQIAELEPDLFGITAEPGVGIGQQTHFVRSRAGGKGVLLVSDTIHVNPDRATVTFMRSYPNRIPLSPGVVERITRAVTLLDFDLLYDNFGRTIDGGANPAVIRSAERYSSWVRGDFDQLT